MFRPVMRLCGLSHVGPRMGQLCACETVRAMTRNLAPAPIPTRENGTVPPRSVPHAVRRPREYLTPTEVERLISAARQNRYGHRDATMIQVAYRHGLRVAELCALRRVGGDVAIPAPHRPGRADFPH